VYRNEWDAAVARANALETQLRQAQSGQQQDAATIATLTQQLQACTAELARLRGPYAPPFGATGYIYAPRAGSILTLGILSLVACTFLGPIAWSMGNTELQRIDAGQTDPSSRGNVAAGRICGMIASVIMIFAILLFAIGFAMAIGNASRY
jgi:hypothetical protein